MHSHHDAIKRIESMLAALLAKIINAHKDAFDALVTHNETLYEQVVPNLKTVEVEANAIDNEIIKTLASYGPETDELRALVAYLKITNELVRIGEGTKKYARRMQAYRKTMGTIGTLEEIIIQLHRSSINAMQHIHACLVEFETCDFELLYRKVMVEESKNDDLFAILEKEILTQIMEHSDRSSEFVRLLGTIRKLERAGDRSANIANLILYVKKGGESNLYT